MSSLAHAVLNFHGVAAYVVVFLLVFGEVGILVGFFVPGETALILSGVLASEHKVSIGLAIALNVLAAVAGNISGYEIGRYFGPWLLNHRPLKGRKAVDQARRLLVKRGAAAIFFGRFVAVVRALIAGLAGASGMTYASFALYSALGGILWAGGYTMLGYAVGASYKKLEKDVGSASIVLLVVVVVAIAAVHVYKKKREAATAE